LQATTTIFQEGSIDIFAHALPFCPSETLLSKDFRSSMTDVDLTKLSPSGASPAWLESDGDDILESKYHVFAQVTPYPIESDSTSPSPIAVHVTGDSDNISAIKYFVIAQVTLFYNSNLLYTLIFVHTR
jgi:hypothetical protein